MAANGPSTVGAPPSGGPWLGMRRACQVLGVNESTLRHWTDSGRVPVFLTPGGHRRYREADLRALTERSLGSGDAGPLASILLATHERYEAVARRAVQKSPWFSHFDEAARLQFRQIGGSMLRSLSAYLVAEGRREQQRCLKQGRDLAAEYGDLAAGAGLSLAEATEAFVVFRHPVLEGLQRWLREQGGSGLLMGEMLRRVDHFMDGALVGMATAHERRTASALAGAAE